MLVSQTQARLLYSMSRSSICHWQRRGWLEPAGLEKNAQGRQVSVYRLSDLLAAKAEGERSRRESSVLTLEKARAAQPVPQGRKQRPSRAKTKSQLEVLLPANPANMASSGLAGSNTKSGVAKKEKAPPKPRAKRVRPTPGPTVITGQRDFDRETFHYTRAGLDRALRELARIAKEEDRRWAESGKDTDTGRCGDESEVLRELDSLSGERGGERGALQGVRRGPLVFNIPE